MKKINLKRKGLGISSIVVISLLLFFSLGPLAYADLPDPDYYIGHPWAKDTFYLQTRTHAGSVPQTYFWFNIRDANYYHAPPMEDVVESATITYPGGAPQPVTPELLFWCNTQKTSTDDNQDGIIDLSAGEYEIIPQCGVEYEVISPESPHVAGTYELNVTCNNGQVLSAFFTTDQAGSELSPVTNVEVNFNDDGLLQVSWDLPQGEYLPEYTIQIRVERYVNRRFKRYDSYRVQNLRHNQTSHTFFKFESDVIRLHTAYIDVRVRTYNHQGSMAQSEVKKYRVKRLLR